MATGRVRLALLLVDPSNPYQAMLEAEAKAMARRLDVELSSSFSGLDSDRQIQQLHEWIQAPPLQRPRAIIVIPNQDSVLANTAREAAEAGIGLAVLNRVPEAILDTVRQEHPEVPVLSFSPDQFDIGRIQGLQYTTLLPKGGRLAYVRGDMTTASAQERQAGMESVVRKTSIEVNLLDGGWVNEQARKSVAPWLRTMAMLKAAVDLIGCQNDDMALGARAAVDAIAADLDRPDLKTVPIAGCDGVPAYGQKYVSTGIIAATIISPATSGAAVEALARHYVQGQAPPPRTVLKARSFPDLSALSARAGVPLK